MIEARSGKVKIDDFKANTVKTMVYYMYNERVSSSRLHEINVDLLRLADKYNVTSLVDFCVHHLEENLSLENALDVLVASHLTNQKSLFDATSNFVYANKENLVKTESWKEIMEANPKLASDVFMTILKLQ